MKMRLLLGAMLLLIISSCKKEDNSYIDDIKSKSETAISAGEIMTLNAISSSFINGYREKETQDLLNKKDLASKGDWKMVWYGYNSLKSVQAMIVKSKSRKNTYALTTTGQNPTNPFALYQGLYVFQMEDFPYVKDGYAVPKVAQGYASLFDLIVNLKPSFSIAEFNNLTIGQTFTKINAQVADNEKVNIYTSGHSLGGANSVGLGVYLQSMFNKMQNLPNAKINIHVYDFAGPSYFSPEFVNYMRNLVNDQKVKFEAYLYAIKNDVPPTFTPFNFAAMGTSFNVNSVMKLFMDDFAKATNGAMDLAGVQYEQIYNVGDPHRITLTNKEDKSLFKVKDDGRISFVDDFINMYCYNHYGSSYLVSLGVPKIPKTGMGNDKAAKVEEKIVPNKAYLNGILQQSGIPTIQE